MQPTRTLWRSQADLLAADTALLAAATAMHVHLAAAPFVPGLDLQLTDLTEATFTGSGPLDAGTGVQPVFYDALDGQLTIKIKEPVGGWLWLCTATPADPETIYGWYITNTDDDELLGSGVLQQAVTIDANGQGLQIDTIDLKFNPTYPN